MRENKKIWVVHRIREKSRDFLQFHVTPNKYVKKIKCSQFSSILSNTIESPPQTFHFNKIILLLLNTSDRKINLRYQLSQCITLSHFGHAIYSRVKQYLRLHCFKSMKLTFNISVNFGVDLN